MQPLWVLHMTSDLCEFYIWRLQLVLQYYDPIQTSNPILTPGINWWMLIAGNCLFNWLDWCWLTAVSFLIWNLQALKALSAHTKYLMCCKRKLETASRCPSFKSQYSKPASHTWQLQLKNSNLICVPMLPNCKYIQGHTQGQSASGAYRRILWPSGNEGGALVYFSDKGSLPVFCTQLHSVGCLWRQP